MTALTWCPPAPPPPLQRSLSLRRNLISSLQTSSVQALSRLRELDLSENKLTELPRDLLQTLSSLIALNIESNAITSCKFDMRAARLRSFRAAFNPLEPFPDVVNLLELTDLSIGQVSISSRQDVPPPLEFEGVSEVMARLDVGVLSARTSASTPVPSVKGRPPPPGGVV
jgi:hypothetical protein